MITLERLQPFKVMITLLDVFKVIPILNNYYKLIATDLSKQQNLDADPKAIKQMNFTGSLSRAEKMRQHFSLLKKQKKQEQLSIMILFRFNKMLA